MSETRHILLKLIHISDLVDIILSYNVKGLLMCDDFSPKPRNILWCNQYISPIIIPDNRIYTTQLKIKFDD